MDSFRRDPGETSERGAKRPRLPAVFEAVKAGRFDELSLTGEIVAQALTFLVWELEELKKQNKTLSDQLKSNALLIDTLRQTITVTQTMTTTTTKATEATRVAQLSKACRASRSTSDPGGNCCINASQSSRRRMCH